MKSLFEEMGGTYHQEGDYLIPNLALPDEPDYQIGKYGRMRRSYLKEHRPILYANLLTSGHRYSGWQVSKESCRDKEGVIQRFAVVAGNPENVCIENPAPVQTAAPETVADARVEIVEYSAKSIAVFGDTKPLRDTLRDLNGLFRACLTHDGTRCAGWIFSKRREQEVRSALAAYLK